MRRGNPEELLATFGRNFWQLLGVAGNFWEKNNFCFETQTDFTYINTPDTR